MTQVGEIFDGLLANLRVTNSETIAARRDEITKKLNSEFRGVTGSTDHRLMAGSYGRFTAINGVSDLDLLYIVPNSLRSKYEDAGGPSRVLSRTRTAIQARYPTTTVRVDRLVVVVEFANFMFEVQPVFENDDDSFSYPDTYSDSWKVTKPRAEISAISADDSLASGNLRRLCKLARAWRNKHGVVMGGLLIDTLAYNFLRAHDHHRGATSETTHLMVRDFFEYLADEEDHEFYAALGSRQRVRVKKKFQKKATKALSLTIEAIDAEGQSYAYKKWRAVFGASVPKIEATEESLAKAGYDDTEEHIEALYPVDIRYDLAVECTVTQDGFRPQSLLGFLRAFKLLPARKQLLFEIASTDVPEPYDVRWKVLNRGREAERRNNIRGEIVKSSSGRQRKEVLSFRGSHYVECYILRNGVVVARDHVDVPISADADDEARAGDAAQTASTRRD